MFILKSRPTDLFDLILSSTFDFIVYEIFKYNKISET